MIQVNNLTQVYKSGKGVFDLDFTIKKGEVFGYLGPNGAGKTTTIRNLLGFANATKGSATIEGLDCRYDAAKLQQKIGYLPGEMAFFDHMTGLEFLNFMGDMREMKDLSRRDELIELLELDTTGKIRKMSKGMKQKLGIIAAFMHDPAVYILDEPTSGLDPLMQNTFMDLVEQEKARGKTIMMSTHIFEEVQRVCDRAGIIKDGRIVAIEDMSSLNEMKQNAYSVAVASQDDMNKIVNSKFETEQLSENKIKVTVNQDFKGLFTLLSTCDVTGLEAIHLSLEDIFMKYYGKDGKTHE